MLQHELEFADTLAPTATLTPDEKAEIIDLLNEAIIRLGTATRVAQKCGVSSATISQILKNQYGAEGDGMWLSIAHTLGWRKLGWQIDKTVTNTATVHKVCQDAQQNSMFIAIAEKSGMSKSAGIASFLAQDKTKNVFQITCRRWSPKEFLVALRRELGLPLLHGTCSVNDMIEQITHDLGKRKGKPLLIIDQANSLQPSVMSALIYLYNDLEDRLGCVLLGTENLEKNMKQGIRNQWNGYDEVHDRFGRTFVHLFGYTYGDVKKMAVANGITNEGTIKIIFQECQPIVKTTDDDREVKIVESGRVIKRKIMKHIMLNQLNAAR